MCFTVLRSARSSDAPLGQRGREGVSIPPPYPLWTPYPPLNDQGMSPWTQMRKVAPGVWLKKLFTAHQMYCASLFPGAIRPALRLCMRALRARLPNVPNEINDFNGFTVPPENHEINDFNEITISRYPPKPTISTKSTKSRFHGTPRKARFQRNQRNHDSTAPQRNHESNETHENNEMPLLRAFRFFRCVWRNRDFVATVGARQKARRVVY